MIVCCVVVGLLLLCISLGPSLYYIIKERILERDKPVDSSKEKLFDEPVNNEIKKQESL